MTVTPEQIRRYARQILLAPIGGPGQERIAAGTVLLHGEAPLCATYLAAAGLGRLKLTGAPPELAARDPALVLEQAAPGDPADVVVDFGDGAAFERATGPALCMRPTDDWTRAVLETVAAGEALRALLGLDPHPYDFFRVRTGPGQKRWRLA